MLLLLARFTQPLHRLEDGVVPALSAHGVGRHVGVAASAVPVARDGLRVKGDHHAVLLDTLVWQPAPFQSPGMGFGSKETTTPYCSHTRRSRKREMSSWSAEEMPSHGPT